MQKKTWVFFWLILASAGVFFSKIDAKTVDFTILTFNDVYTVAPDNDGRGGYASMYTLLKQEREKAAHHITTLNGDFLFPSILSTYDKGAHRIELMNLMGIDLVVLGNHEFDFGPDVLKMRMGESQSRWLTANAFGVDCQYFTGPEQTFIVDVDGVKIGFFGLVTVETPLLSSTEKKVYFTPLALTANQMIHQLKEQGADVIVALTHLGIDEDRQLAAEVPEIDVILGGHDHDPITWYDGKTLIHKSGQNAYFLTTINLKVQKNEQTSVVRVYPSWNVLSNLDVEPDPLIAARVEDLESRFDDYAIEPVVVTNRRLDSTYPGVRSRESTIGNLVTDAMRVMCKADMAIICGGIIRGNKIYEAGSVLTLKDFLSELPFANLNMVIELKGEDIWAALENGVSQIEGKAGRFPVVSGIEYAFDFTQPVGSRISYVKFNGKKLNMNTIYKVATIDYLYNGGDGYSTFKNGNVILGLGQHMETVATVVDYVKTLGALNVKLDRRIVCLNWARNLDENFLVQTGATEIEE